MRVLLCGFRYLSADTADFIGVFSHVLLNEGNVLDGHSAVAVAVSRNKRVARQLRNFSKVLLNLGGVGDGDLTVLIGVADEDTFLRLGLGLCGRFCRRLGGGNRRLAAVGVQIHNVDNAGSVVAACVAGDNRVISAGEHRGGVGAGGVHRGGVLHNIGRELLAGFNADVAGLDGGVKADLLALNGRFACYQIAGLAHAGLLLAAGDTEDNICAAGRNGADPLAVGERHLRLRVLQNIVPLAEDVNAVLGVGIHPAVFGGGVVLIVNLCGGGGKLFIGKGDGLVVAVKHADGLGRIVGGIQLIALNGRSAHGVSVAFLVVGFLRLLHSGAGAVLILNGEIAVLDSGVAVGEGDGVVAVCLNRAGGAAGGVDKLAAEQNRAVGQCAIGVAGAILRVLRLEGGAAFGDMLHGQRAIGIVDGLRRKIADQHNCALAGNGYGAAVEVGNTLDVRAGLGNGAARYGVGNNLPGRSAETGDGVRAVVVVIEHANLAPFAGAAVVGIGNNMAFLGNPSGRHKGVAVNSAEVGAHRHHGLVPLRQRLHGVGARPVDFVNRVAGFIAVGVALLGASHFGACRHERNTLRGHQQRHGTDDLILNLGVGAGVVGGAVGLHELVPHDQVIVRVGISDRLRGCLCGKALAVDAGNDLAGVGGSGVLNKAAVSAVGAALDSVAVAVVEHADTGIQRGSSCLGAGVGALRAAACPGLAVHQNVLAGAVAVQTVELGADVVHGGGVMQRHEVETEAVDVIFLCPVCAGINHILAEHTLIRSGFVAAARAVGISGGGGHSVVVARNGLAEAGAVGQIGVVVNNVHNNGDASVVKRLHHLLKLGDSGVAVVGVRGIGALGNVVVDGVIAPVAVGGGGSDGFVHGAKVINRLQLNGVHALLNKVVNAGGHRTCLSVEGSAALGKGKVSALVFLADAGGVGNREVTHMHFPNHTGGRGCLEHVFVGAPALGVGGVEVNNHRAVAVDAGRLGINVLGFVGAALDVDQIGVINVLIVTLESHRPNARGGVLGHIILADGAGTRFVVRAGFVQLDLNGGRVGRPCFPRGGGFGIGRAKIIGALRIARVVFQIALVGIADRLAVNADSVGNKGCRAHDHHRGKQQR